MKIAVDAMGGDYAPEAVVEGVLLAEPQCPADLLLIGNQEQLQQVFEKLGTSSAVQVIHAPEVIGNGEAGSLAIRKKREASLSIAMRLLAEDAVDAVVSAGNSAAVVATAKHFVGLISGLRRPALAVPLPSSNGGALLLDAGAHAEASAIHLAQAAALAQAYLKATAGMDRARIGLINIGREPIKGPKVIQRTFALLERSRLHFIGNIEPQDLFDGHMDVAVCDGFMGNVVLKLCEGLSQYFMQSIEAEADGREESDARRALPGTVSGLQKQYRYQDVGGAPLLGIRKTVVVAHGRSQGSAIANAIQRAFQLVDKKVYECMSDDLEKDSVLTELRNHNALLMLENIRLKWGFAQKKNQTGN